MSSVDIYIDPGHYQFRGKNLDRGIVTADTNEAEQAVNLALTLKAFGSVNYGLKIQLSRFGEQTPSYPERIIDAVRYRAKMFLSVHFDIPQPGWRWGCYYGNARSKEAATRLSQALDPINGDWGVWTKHHTESYLGGLFIRAFPGYSLLAEFGPTRIVSREERISIAEAILPVLARMLKK